MNSLEKNQELFERKKQLESQIEQSSEQNEYLNDIQTMRLLLNPTENLQEGFRQMLKRKNQDCLAFMKFGVLLIDELSRVYKQKDNLQICKDELEKINEKLMKDQKEILQMNQTLENKSEELIKIINQQDKKLRENEQNELKLEMERSSMKKKLDEFIQTQQKKQDQLLNSSEQQLVNESISEIKSKFAQLKQVSFNIRTKILDQSRKFVKKIKVSSQQYLFSSTPASITRERKFKESLKNIKLNRRAQQSKEDIDDKLKMKTCESIFQDSSTNQIITNQIMEKNSKELNSLNQSSCQDPHLLSDQIKCFNFQKVKEVKNISNLDDFNQSKHQFSTRVQSNIKQFSQIGITKSESMISDISFIQKASTKVEVHQTWNHIHSIITDTHEEKCLCKKVSHQLNSAHNLLFNYIVKDRIEPRRTIRKRKQNKEGDKKKNDFLIRY